MSVKSLENASTTTTTTVNQQQQQQQQTTTVTNTTNTITTTTTTAASTITPSSIIGTTTSTSGIVRSGYLKKLKTSRRKFFVLRAETPDTSARLEYYDSERKFQHGQPPKRCIPLKNCFNINKRLDTKHKHVIALYTKDDCFCIVLDNDDELDSWLKSLLALQHGEDVVDGEPPRPTFEHVWQVTVLSRGLGNLGLTGHYRLCLTDKTLSLIRKDTEMPQIELSLTNIRSCGSLKDYFFLEIGRSSTLGAGELWMETEDANIAQNVHSTVYHAMTTNKNDDFGPKSRNRSSSATEASKPNTTGRKQIIGGGVGGVSQTTTGTKGHIFSQGASGGRERCDSMPSSRARTTSEGGAITTTTNNHHMSIPIWPRSHHLTPYRPASLYGRDISHSPPSGSPVSPPSVGCSTDSAGSSYSLADETEQCCNNLNELLLDQTSSGGGGGGGGGSIGGRYSHSLTPDEAIAEEDCCSDSPNLLYSTSPNSTTGTNNYVPMNLHSSDDGYVDMSPKGRHQHLQYHHHNHHHHHHQYHHHNNSPTASLSSVTSGTPSTDMRFSEYPLEKVFSYLQPNTDTDTDDCNTRPTRCYSVGSKPDRYKKYLDLLSNNIDNRVRAFSVGSKTSKKLTKMLLPHYHFNNNNNNNNQQQQQQQHNVNHIKSSSAPILTRIQQNSSHSSVGPMDDLMEMDFTRTGYLNHHSLQQSQQQLQQQQQQQQQENSGYVEMKPITPQSTTVTSTTTTTTSTASTTITTASTTTTNHGYVEMKPGIPPLPSPDTTSAYVDMTSSLSPAKLPENPSDDYMEMGPKKNNSNTNNNNNNTNSILSFLLKQQKPNDYNHHNCNNHNDGCINGGSPRFLETTNQTPDGYVEMSLGKSNQHQRQSSLDSQNGDYTDMTIGLKQQQQQKKNKTNGKNPRSQPIAIQNSKERTPTTSIGSPMYYSSFINGRKLSTGNTPPKMHLPLSSTNSINSGSYSSLPRQQRSRKNSRRDSKDSSSSSLTTPSSSSTIFPISLNSPCSPIKTELPVTTTITTTTQTTIKVPPSVLNTVYKKPKKTDNDYMPMDFEQQNNKNDQSDYVNFNPSGSNDELTITSLNDSHKFRAIDKESSSTSSSTSSLSSFEQRVPRQTTIENRLHYASLDLDNDNSGVGGGNNYSNNGGGVSNNISNNSVNRSSPRTIIKPGGQSSSNNDNNIDTGLTYAAIDFIKSGELKAANKH